MMIQKTTNMRFVEDFGWKLWRGLVNLHSRLGGNPYIQSLQI